MNDKALELLKQVYASTVSRYVDSTGAITSLRVTMRRDLFKEIESLVLPASPSDPITPADVLLHVASQGAMSDAREIASLADAEESDYRGNTESAPVINYISRPAPDDSEYSATCSRCGGAAKPGGNCLSCGEPVSASEPNLRDAVERLRAIPSAWKERGDPLGDLEKIRNGIDPSAPASEDEKCGACVIHFIAREGSFFPCALPKGHDGGHRAGGNCFRHGVYVGEVGAVPNCPQWPKCAEPPYTEEELMRSMPRPEQAAGEGATPDREQQLGPE